MSRDFPVAVKAKLTLTAIHCLLYFTYLNVIKQPESELQSLVVFFKDSYNLTTNRNILKTDGK